MRGEANGQVRTEGELRSALMSLERHAPNTDAVLRAVRDRAGRRRPALGWGLRAPRSAHWPKLAMVMAAAAAAAGITIALLPGGAPSRPGHARPGPAPAPGPAAAGRPPSAASVLVGKAMLTAFSAAQDDIVYTRQTGTNHGTVTDIYQDWSWPAQPVTGQPARWRGTYTGRIALAKPLKLTEDDGFVFTAPPPPANFAYGELTVVCYAGTGQTSCGYGDTDTPVGAWSLHRGRFVDPNTGLDDLSPAALARDIIKGLWVVTGHTRLNGRPAIELTETPAGIYQPLPTLLWVDAHTHLPLRMINGPATLSSQVDWSYLKPTAANMARLQVPIPAGYPRVNRSTH
jgi:hypothetical protein